MERDSNGVVRRDGEGALRTNRAQRGGRGGYRPSSRGPQAPFGAADRDVQDRDSAQQTFGAAVLDRHADARPMEWTPTVSNGSQRDAPSSSTRDAAATGARSFGARESSVVRSGSSDRFAPRYGSRSPTHAPAMRPASSAIPASMPTREAFMYESSGTDKVLVKLPTADDRNPVRTSTGSSSLDVDEKNSNFESPALWSRMRLLEGPVLEIVVGREDLTFPNRKRVRKWCLSKALLSHVSPVLKYECDRGASDSSGVHMALLHARPAVFAMFVDWMFKGCYDTTDCAQQEPGTNPNLKAWFLGDKLQCIDFQNHAMAQIYSLHCSELNYKLVAPADVNLVFSSKASSPLLRQFYLDFITTYLPNHERVKGTTDDWDTVLQAHPRDYKAVLSAFRNFNSKQSYIKSQSSYMIEKKEVALHPALEQSSGVVTPSKRTYDGAPVKKDTPGPPPRSSNGFR